MNKSRMCSTALALMLAAAPAIAADMPLKAPPAPIAAYNWTGFYLGADIGVLEVDAKATTTSVTGFGGAGPNALVPFAQPVKFDNVGFRGGVFGGYDWQFAPSWVVGLEADWHGEDNKTTQPGFAIGLPSRHHDDQRDDRPAGFRAGLPLQPQAADARRRVRLALQVLIGRRWQKKARMRVGDIRAAAFRVAAVARPVSRRLTGRVALTCRRSAA